MRLGSWITRSIEQHRVPSDWKSQDPGLLWLASERGTVGCDSGVRQRETAAVFVVDWCFKESSFDHRGWQEDGEEEEV